MPQKIIQQYLLFLAIVLLSVKGYGQGFVKNIPLSIGAKLTDENGIISYQTNPVFQKHGVTAFNNANGKLLFYFDGYYIYTPEGIKLNNKPFMPLANAGALHCKIIPHLSKKDTYWLFAEGFSGYDHFAGEKPNAIFPSRIFYHEVYYNPNSNELHINYENKILYNDYLHGVDIVFNKEQNFYWVSSLSDKDQGVVSFKFTECGLSDTTLSNINVRTKSWHIETHDWVRFNLQQNQLFVYFNDNYIGENDIWLKVYNFNTLTSELQEHYILSSKTAYEYGIRYNFKGPIFSQNSEFLFYILAQVYTG